MRRTTFRNSAGRSGRPSADWNSHVNSVTSSSSTVRTSRGSRRTLMTSLLYQQKLFGQDHAIIPEFEQVIARPRELTIRDREERAVNAARVCAKVVFLRPRRPTGTPRVVLDEHDLRLSLAAPVG